MGKWIYRKLELSSIRGICVICGIKPQRKDPRKGCYRPYCRSCARKLYESSTNSKSLRRADKRRRPYRQYVGGSCISCGFIPEHICQLDVDHIDNNHSNNSIENLQTLCANCHRLKTNKENWT